MKAGAPKTTDFEIVAMVATVVFQTVAICNNSSGASLNLVCMRCNQQLAQVADGEALRFIMATAIDEHGDHACLAPNVEYREAK